MRLGQALAQPGHPLVGPTHAPVHVDAGHAADEALDGIAQPVAHLAVGALAPVVDAEALLDGEAGTGVEDAEGTSAPRSAFRPGFGLTSMRERVEDAGGQLEIVSGPGQFRVRGSFPLKA